MAVANHSHPVAPAARPDTRPSFVLGMLCFVYVLNFLDRQLLSILAKPIQDSLQITDGQLGLISGLYFAMFYCFIAIPVGWLADRTSRVGVLSLACAIWSGATVACGMAANYGQLVAARMAVGIGEAGGVPPSYAIITDTYPPGKRAWSLPLVRAFAGLTFTGEIWDTSIQMFSNLPYWSLHYEVWYYAAFAVLTYIGGRKRTMLFVLLCAFVGPKLLLLMPVWWAGVLLYRWQRLRNISMNAGYLMVALSTMALFLYNPMGPQAAPTVAFYPLGFSDRFLTDYLFALIVVAHFLGVRAICLRHGSLLLAAERPIRSLAATTFALYLLHQPLLLFFNAAYFAQPFTMTRYVLVMLSTILSAFALNNAIEANKKPLRWVIARLADGVHTSSYRLLRPFAKTT